MVIRSLANHTAGAATRLDARGPSHRGRPDDTGEVRSGDGPLSVRVRPSSPKRDCARRTTSSGRTAPVNVHAKSRLTLETTADTPVRTKGQAGACPEPDASHPLQGAGGHCARARWGLPRCPPGTFGPAPAVIPGIILAVTEESAMTSSHEILASPHEAPAGPGQRQHWADNLRVLVITVVVVWHTAQAYLGGSA